jgi:hypothetical protein
MARRHPKTCKVCGRTEGEGFTISATGLCLEHSLEREAENIVSLKTKTGEPFQWWRYRLAASVGFASLDDRPERV